MRLAPLAKAIALIGATTLMAACIGSSDSGNDNDLDVGPINAYLLTSNNRIIGVDLDQPQFALSVIAALQGSAVNTTGALDPGEEILDIDFRNAEGTIYALTRTGTVGRVIIINPASGQITRVSTLVADAADNVGNPTAYSGLAASGVSYTIDFNPAVDRLRVFGSNGSNLRIDALTGETFTDGDVNGAAGASITGTAYRDTFAAGGAGRGTALFSIDAVTDAVYPTTANAGTLGTPKLLGVGDVATVNGYDINPENNAGVAVLTVGSTPRVYSINPDAAGNAASAMGVLPTLPGSETYKGLAIVTLANPTVTALNSTNELITFRARTPGEVSAKVPVTLPSGSLVAIDFRQSDRVLYGLASTGSIFNLTNPAAPTAISTITLTGGVGYSADFNPTIPGTGTASNRLRLIGDNDSNAVVNIDTGAVTGNDNVNGTPNPEVVSSAYLNNFRTTTTTTLLVIDRVSASLNVQTVTAPTAPATTPIIGQLSRVSSLGITPLGPVGFDISGRNNDNALLMARTAAGPHTLYRINTVVTSNPLTAVGQIGGSGGASDLLDIAIRF